MHNCFLSFLTFEVKMIQNTNKFLFYMHFKNVFKSSKGALIKEKIFWHFLIPHTNFVWLHFHLNRHGAIGSRTRPRAWWYFLRAFTRKNPYGSTSLLSALLGIKAFCWFHTFFDTYSIEKFCNQASGKTHLSNQGQIWTLCSHWTL